MFKKVAVILVNWNGFDVTAQCIRSLRQMDYDNYDIIVTDNGSSDGSCEKIKNSFTDIHLIQSDVNLGFAGGNNIALQHAMERGYEYVLMLNNDTEVKENLLPVLIDYMDEHPDTGAIQPLIFFHHNRKLVWNSGSGFNSWLGITYTPGYYRKLTAWGGRKKEVDWITGCALLTRMEILKQTGFLAENMFAYYEDVDLSFRIRQAGYKLFFHPDTCVYHIAGASGKSKTKGPEGYLSPNVHYINLRNRIWFLKKYTPAIKAPTTILATSLYVLLLALYFIVRGRFQKLKAVGRAVKDGLKGHIIIS